MSRLLNINAIALHCTAGFADVKGIEAYWLRPVKQNGAGWKRSKGYHIIIELDGTSWYLVRGNLKNGYSKNPKDLNLEEVTNGVLGYNKSLINIATIGGVDRNNVNKAVDTRTEKQKESLHINIQLVLGRLVKAGKDVTKNLGVYGHRDYSPDKDGSGVIEPRERIKECPSWDVIDSVYHSLYSSNDRLGKLPYN